MDKFNAIVGVLFIIGFVWYMYAQTGRMQRQAQEESQSYRAKIAQRSNPQLYRAPAKAQVRGYAYYVKRLRARVHSRLHELQPFFAFVSRLP